MWPLYESYKRGRNRLLPMAYACYTYIENSAGGVDQVAKQYCVSKKVLSDLRGLTSTLGVGAEARKFSKNWKSRAPTAGEKRWIEVVVQTLIQRAGEVVSDPHKEWPQITKNDLPEL